MQEADISTKVFEIVSNVPDGQFVFIEDIAKGISNWSRDAVDYFGLPGVNLTNTSEVIGNLVHPEDLERWKKEVDDAFAMKSDGFFLTYQIKNAKGEYVHCTGKGKIILGDGGRPLIFAGSITVHQGEESNDAITDLPKFQSFLKNVSQTKKEKHECLLVALEIRRFGSINALYGYNFGSKTLYETAQMIKEIVGDCGRVYRLEGISFGILFKKNDLEFAKTVFSQIREKMASFSLDGTSINIEICGGALYTRNYTVSSQTVYSCLLSALEKAKDEDAYDMVIFDDESHETNYKMLELLDAIKSGIRNNCEGFYLCYQPFVSTVTGKIIGAEALIRWRSPVFGEVSPGRFVPHLESHPCFYDLSIWVLRKAIEDTREILVDIPGFFINVNMSYSQLERPEFKQAVIDILEEFDFPKTNLQLELTERCRNLDMKYLREQLEFFRSYDIKIALDDYGTGNSTINLLCDLPITCVKIDQTFILHILDKSNNRVVVDSTVQCAKRLGLNVCFEGVETQEIKDFIGKYSANYHQGYFYSRPVEFEKFKEFLKDTWTVSEVSLIKGNPRDTFGVDNILSMIPGGFFIYTNDEAEKLVSVNEMLLEIFDCKTLNEFLELTGGSFKGIVHPEDYQEVSRSIIEQIAKSDSNLDFVKYRIITQKGKVKYVRDYGHLVKNENDADLYYVFLVEEH
ncbi:MAG: EAL domain-containing protein [Lachnospiraceae bacterium]|nr:EAL domain-containing protein [Lachnospiraceae bacterium]